MIRSKVYTKPLQSKNKSVIILANGPSLSKSLPSLTPKKNLDYICVNNFTNTEDFVRLKPKHYVVVSEQFYNVGNSIKENNHRESMIESLINKTTWPLVFHCPVSAKKHSAFIDRIKKNKLISINYFNTTPIEGFKWFKILAFRLGLGSPRPHNVLIPSLLIAINTGFKKVILIGADHSWLKDISVNDNNEALVNQKHFYDANTSKPEIMRNKGVQPRKLHEILQKFVYSFSSYFDLREFATSRNVDIYNATPNSFIDAFERKDLGDVQ